MPFLFDVYGRDGFIRYKMSFDTTKPDVSIGNPKRFKLFRKAQYFLVNGVFGYG